MNIEDTRHGQLSLSTNSLSGYLLLDINGAAEEEPFVIGKGGSGIVYKARQQLYQSAYVDRAVKFFIYEDSILTNFPDREPISEEDFISEIGNITTFNHQSLIRVIDAGYHMCDAGKIPYIISDFIEGTTLKHVIDPVSELDRSINKCFIEDPDLVLDFLLDVAYAIKHIHEHKYAHCDIAPKNIFIQFSGENIKPILGDLGISKPINSEKKSKTRIIGSRSWMPQEAIALYDKEVDYKTFSKLQPYWDIYSFSKTGLVFLEIFGGKKPRSWFISLEKDFQAACSDKDCLDIDGLIERIEFLKPIHREVAKVQELSMGVGSGRRKMMPVEALTTTKRLHDLVRHPGLLRLSFVPQLTTANQILPGANHTRYEHTLGVIETMRRYLLSLLDESEFLQHLSTKKIETALLVAALSCATRFPLSNVLHEIKDKESRFYKDFSKHSFYMEVLRIEDSSGVALKDYIRQEYPNVAVSDLVAILCHEEEKFDDADQLIYSLLNNSLDVRVIDFVRRDSHHLGTISGDSFEIDEILPHVTIHDHKLALKIQGVSIAEQIVLLRYWLFSRVYWNQPNRTFCAMARMVFSELHGIDAFAKDLRANVLQLDQRGMVEFLIDQCEKHYLPELSDLSMRLLGREHLLFRVLFETNRVNRDLDGAFEKLQLLGLVELKDLAKNIWDNLVKAKGLECPNNKIPIIVDYPVEPGSTKMGQDVRVRLDNGEFKDLLDVSGIIKGVNQSFNNQLTRFRVFIHPDIKTIKVDRAEYIEIVKNSVVEFINHIKNK